MLRISGRVRSIAESLVKSAQDGGKSSGREALSDPSEEKYASLAVFWSAGLPSFKSGLAGFEEESDGEAKSACKFMPAPVQAEAHDFRKP